MPQIQNSPSALHSRTDQTTPPFKIATRTSHYGVDSFKGKVKQFQKYIQNNRRLLEIYLQEAKTDER